MLLALSVVSGSRTGRESRFANFDLEAVTLVGMVSRRRIKAESVEHSCAERQVASDFVMSLLEVRTRPL